MDHNLPPDELNRVKQIGSHFGFPYCYGYNVRDKEILPNETIDCKKYVVNHTFFIILKIYKGS